MFQSKSSLNHLQGKSKIEINDYVAIYLHIIEIISKLSSLNASVFEQ